VSGEHVQQVIRNPSIRFIIWGDGIKLVDGGTANVIDSGELKQGMELEKVVVFRNKRVEMREGSYKKMAALVTLLVTGER